MLNPQQTLNCNGQLLLLDTPKIMGILNVTPDSFFDGGRYSKDTTILAQAEKMLSEGASMIDIGGMSSRPGAAVISEKEEWSRVLPVIKSLKKEFPKTILSIDTVHSEVARACVGEGAGIINDISAGKIDPTFYKTVAALNVPYVLMHMQGKPSDMQDAPQYEDIVVEVLDFFIAEIEKLRALGLKDIILDVGFGFGKTSAHNFELLQKMHAFQILDLPILVGLSRKSMVYKTLKTSPENALNGTTALHIIALQQGAKILRVHDVCEAMEAVILSAHLGGEKR